MGIPKDKEESEKKNSDFKGSKSWMAPQRIAAEESKYLNRDLAKAEVFSLGLIFMYCLDPESCEKHLLNCTEKEKDEYLETFKKEKELTNELGGFSDLLSRMLSWDPERRPDIEALYYWIKVFVYFVYIKSIMRAASRKLRKNGLKIKLGKVL